MKINSINDNYKIGNIKTENECTFDKKSENKYKYDESINNLFEKHVKEEFEFSKVVGEIKSINYKYFDETSESNIINKDYYKKKEDNQSDSKEYSMENSTIDIVNNMKYFVNDYNSLIDKVKVLLNESHKNNKIQINKNIEQEEYSKLVNLRKSQKENEKKLKSFIQEIQSDISSTITEMGKKIAEVGLSGVKENEAIKLELDENMYKRAIEENGRGVYKVLIGFDEDSNTVMKHLKKTFKNYSNDLNNIFDSRIKDLNKKNPILDIEQIKKQEDEIKILIEKMNKKEKNLGGKFNILKSNLELCDKQIESLI